MDRKKEDSSLTGKQVRHLRGLGHHLKPVVLVGKEGTTPALLDAVDESLAQHELVKIKLLENCPDDRRTAADNIARQSGASVVQILGRTLLLYRAAEPPVIVLP